MAARSSTRSCRRCARTARGSSRSRHCPTEMRIRRTPRPDGSTGRWDSCRCWMSTSGVQRTRPCCSCGPLRSRPTDRSKLRCGAVALLVFEAAAARARGVPRRLVADRLVRVAWLRAGACGSSVAALAGRARHDVVAVLFHPLNLRRLGLLVLADEFDAVDVLDEVLADRRRERLEHIERLALVLDEWVLLSVGPQVDALLQIVHLVEMLAPLRVGDVQQDDPLELAHHVGADRGLLLFVRREGLLDEPRPELVLLGDAGDVLLGARHGEDLAEGGQQPGAVL